MTTAFAGFPPLLLVLTLASTTAVSLAALAALLLRRHSAALRHFLWLLALATPLVALPLYRFHPYLDLKVLPPAPIRIAPALPANDPAPLQITPPESSPANAPLPPPPTLPTQLIFLIESWNPWLVAWTLGALIIAARILLAHAHVRRLLRTHSGWAPAELLTRLHEASAFFHLGRAPHLRISPLIEIPLCHGLLRPTVLFPESWREWNSERIDICLTHELAHLRRRDLAAMALGQAACLLCWFNPLVWLAAARLRDEAESAADDLVLARNIRPETYAANLVALTEKFRASALAPTIALSMARPNRLRSRIESILDATLLRRAPHPRLFVALALSATALLLLAMSLRLTAQETNAAPNPTTTTVPGAKAYPPPIYVRFDKIGGRFFGPISQFQTDESHAPGTDLLLSAVLQSATATEATLRFNQACPAGLQPMKDGKPIHLDPSQTQTWVTVPLGQTHSFRIFNSIDVTTSPTPEPEGKGDDQPLSSPKDFDSPLTIALQGHDEARARALIEKGAPVTFAAMEAALETGTPAMAKLLWERNPHFCSVMTYAISQGATIPELEDLRAHGVPVERDYENTITPLGMAARLGNLPVAQWLVDHGAYVNGQGGRDPMYLAMWGDSPEMVDFLIRKGARIDGMTVATAGGLPDFSQSGVEEKRVAMIKVLVAAGALDKADEHLKARLLSEACWKTAPDLVRYYLGLGISPLSRTYDAKTVLEGVKEEYARRGGDPAADGRQSILALLEAAADKSASPNSNSNTSTQAFTTDPAALQKQMLEAACKGDIKTVDALLAQGVNVNDPAFSQTTGRTLLGNVATVGQTEMINYLADHGADVNARDKGNQVALTYALNFGKDDAACALIAHGADFSHGDNLNPNEAWLAASMFYCPDALQLMIQKGVNVLGTDPRGENIISHISHFGVLSKSHPSYFGGTPYSDVAQKAYEAREQRVVEMLLAAGVDPNGRDGTETPLMTMLRSNHFAAARALLDHGVNLTFKDADGNTALAYLFSWSGRNEFPLDILDTLLKEGANPNTVHHWPAQPPESVPLLEEAIGLATHQENLVAYPQAVKMLLDHGATFFGVTDYKVQDLLRAAARGDLPAIQKAVQEGAGINAASGSGWTALAISTSLGYDDCTNWLLAQGADVNARAGKRWWDPLTFAVARGQADLVDTLIAKGAKPTWGDGGISSAVQQNNQRIFDALIKAGANPKPIDLSTITIGNISYHPIDNLPLYTCIKNGQTAMALTLLDKGADPEPQGPRDNQNLAYFAVQYNRPEILQALLNHGANPTLKDSHGESPLDLAQKSHPNLVPMLQAAAANGPHADAAPASGNSNVGAASSYPNKKDIIATTYWNAKTPGPFYAALPFNDLANPDAAEKWLPSSWATAASTGPQPRSACLGHWLKITNQAGASCYAQWEDFGPGADTDPDYVFGNQPPKNAQAPALDLSPAAAQFLGLDDKHKTVAWQFIDQKDVPPGPWLPAHPNTPATTP